MAKQQPLKNTGKQPEQPCKPGEEFQPKQDLDGKNDSGPDPEIHRDAPSRPSR
jgi:hypothetical protein